MSRSRTGRLSGRTASGATQPIHCFTLAAAVDQEIDVRLDHDRIGERFGSNDLKRLFLLSVCSTKPSTKKHVFSRGRRRCRALHTLHQRRDLVLYLMSASLDSEVKLSAGIRRNAPDKHSCEDDAGQRAGRSPCVEQLLDKLGDNGGLDAGEVGVNRGESELSGHADRPRRLFHATAPVRGRSERARCEPK